MSNGRRHSLMAARVSVNRLPRTRRAMLVVITLIAIFGLWQVNQPVRSFAVGEIHQYQTTQPGYEAHYGLWTQLNIPGKYQINGIHATVLSVPPYQGWVLIMAGSGNDQAFFNAGTFKTLLLNPFTMQMRLIKTPWDLFCAGHIELPDGNILIAGGTARYEVLNPTNAGGSMTVTNWDQQKSITLPKGTIFMSPTGAQFRIAFAVTVGRATQSVNAKRQTVVTPGTSNVWVDAVASGKGSVSVNTEKYLLIDHPELSSQMVYGIGTPMTLQKQNFQGLNDAYIYNVRLARFQEVDSMHYARWYPTLAEMGNGMDMTMSGLDGTGNPTTQSEEFNPTNDTWSLGPIHGFPTYPATFLTAAGQLFFTGSNAGYGPNTPAWREPGIWNVTTNKFTPLPGIPDPQDLETSASVLLPPAQKQTFMVLGGGGVGSSNQSTARTALINLSVPMPHWTLGPSLPRPTRYPIVVTLPSNEVLVTGGSEYYRGEHGSDNRDTEIYNPAANSMSTMANSITGRDYHSGGLLLPYGAVLTLGGNPLYGNSADTEGQTFNHEIDIYWPPYLFTRTARPKILSAPQVMLLGHNYTVRTTETNSIAYFTLMRPDNMTHVTDVNARSIAVPFKRLVNGELQLTMPQNNNLVPPSYYMLFAINSRGVPSVASWVQVP